MCTWIVILESVLQNTAMILGYIYILYIVSIHRGVNSLTDRFWFS